MHKSCVSFRGFLLENVKLLFWHCVKTKKNFLFILSGLSMKSRIAQQQFVVLQQVFNINNKNGS